MDTNLLNGEMKELLGIHDPVFFNCIIGVSFDNNVFIIKTENNFEELFDSSDLEDNLTDIKNLPQNPGIWK